MMNKKLVAFINYYHIWYLIYICFVLFLFTLTFLPFIPPFFVQIPLVVAFIDIAWRALHKLKEKKIGTELFLVIATIISFIGHQEQAMTIVLLIMLVAEYLEELITDRTTRAIKSLIDLIPDNATVQIDHTEKIMPVSEVKPGMRIIVKTGGKIPVDGIILEGMAEINEASLTGESKPKEKAHPEKVYAGTYIESGALIVEAQKVGKETFFSKITTLVEQAEEKKARVTILTDRIAFYLVPSLLIIFGIVWLITKDLNLVTTLLVFGSPLELTLITPLTILAGIIASFRNGIMVKGGIALERFSRADTLIVDKTGTLTMGEPRVVSVQVIDPSFTQQEIIQLAAIAEKRSGHVISKALLHKAQQEGIVVPDPDKYEYVSGHGVEISYKNQHCFLGNRHFIEAPEHGNIKIPTSLSEEQDEKYSSFYLGCSGKLYGKIFIADQMREDAQQTIAQLKKDIPHIMLISGDKQAIVNTIAAQLGINQAFGGVFPDQKLSIIED